MQKRRLIQGYAFLALALLLGCADGVTDPEVTPKPKPETQVIADRVHPTLTLQAPLRGTFTAASDVEVRGTVKAGSAPLSALTVAGEDVTIGADGGFSHLVVLKPGPNILEVRVTAEDSGRAVDAVAIYAGQVHANGALLSDALALHLGPSFLDDNEDELDDLARIVEVMLSDAPFLQTFTNVPYDFDGDTMMVTDISITDAGVDLLPEVDCLFMSLTLGEQLEGAGGHMDMSLNVSGMAALLGDVIHLHTVQTKVEARLCPTADADGALAVELRDAVVTFDGFLLSTSDLPNLATDLPSVHDALKATLESYLVDWLTTSLGDMLVDFLGAFEMAYTFGVTPPISAAFEIEGVSVSPSGLEMRMSASFSAPLGLPVAPLGAGSLRTDDAPLAADFSTQPVAVALSDDAVNQLLYAFWYGGGIAAYDIPTDQLTALPEVFQPLSTLDVGMQLPSTLLPPDQPEYTFDISTGGLSLDLLAGADRWFHTMLHVRTGVDVGVNDKGELTFDLDDRAQKITVKASVEEVPAGLDKGDVAALLRMMVPTILGTVTVSYGGFPIPALELSLFSENVSVFQGKSLTFAPANIGKAGSGGGFVLAEGAIVEVE